jgi:hypothetical protein
MTARHEEVYAARWPTAEITGHSKDSPHKLGDLGGQ